MTDREAMAIFTGLKLMVGTTSREACDIALSALQERIDRENKMQKPMTNADRIRAMSDEELSEWILRNVDCGKEGVMCTKSANSCNGRCRKNRLDWLRKPAKED